MTTLPPVEYLPAGQDFQAALETLQDLLPSRWRSRDPSSQLYLVLQALGVQVDEIFAVFEACLLDQTLATATLDGLERTWEPLWGVQNEQLQQEIGTLVPYIQARSQEDGTPNSLLTTLLALIVPTLINRTTGTVVLLSSLTFPSNGLGLQLWQWDGSTYPLPSPGMIFPLDGSGITFPRPAAEVFTDAIMANDGTSGITGFGSYPLVFSNNNYVNVLPNYTGSQFTVQVKSACVFDRGAFKRAVYRFRLATLLPPIVQEIP